MGSLIKKRPIFSDNASATGGGGAGGGTDLSNEIVINQLEAPIVGKQYQTFEDAFTYINTQSPSATNPWAIKFSGQITENLTGTNKIPKWVSIVGESVNSSIIDGDIDFEEPGDIDSANSGNKIENCTIKNIALTGDIQNTTYNIVNGVAYAADSYLVEFASIPIDGTFILTLMGISTAPIAYDADDAAILSAIMAIEPIPGMFAGLTVTSTTNFDFRITLGGLPVGCHTWLTCSAAYTHGGSGAIIVMRCALSNGTTQRQDIVFNEHSDSGVFQFSFTFMGVTETTGLLAYNVSAATVRTTIQTMFTNIETALGLPADTLGGSTLSVSIYNIVPTIYNYRITFNNFPGEAPLFVMIPGTYMVQYYEGKLYHLQNCLIKDATVVSGHHQIMCTNTSISGGDFSNYDMVGIGSNIFFESYILSYNNIVLGYLNAMSSCLITCVNNISLQRGSFYNSTIYGVDNLTILDFADFHSSLLIGNLTILPNTSIYFRTSYIAGNIYVGNNTGGVATLYTRASFVEQGSVIIDAFGVWDNEGVLYDNRTSGLTSDETQGAIDELKASIDALGSNELPIFYDDFLGQQRPEWATRITTGSVTFVNPGMGGIVKDETGATINNEESSDFDDNYHFYTALRPAIEVRVKLTEITDVMVDIGFLDNDAMTPGGVKIHYESIGGNWCGGCYDGANISEVVGSVPTTNWVILKLVWNTATEVEFFIDGVSQGTANVTSAITTAPMQLVRRITTLTNAAKSLEIDYVKVWQNR